jgi:hypothetical protein
MLVSTVVTVLALIAPSAAAKPKLLLRPMQTFASAPRTCAVLQAAYTAAIGQDATAYPKEVGPSRHILDDLRTFTPDYRGRLPLSAKEFEELATRQSIYHVENFKPICDWQGKGVAMKNDEGHQTFVTFTSPIFSRDGHVALTEVSFQYGAFGYGLICVARSRHEAWSARCLQSWIT